MKLAVLILAHKDPLHMQRLIKRLNHPCVDFFIHIDKKADLLAFSNIIQGLDLKNVHVIESQKVYWGSISQTEARLRLIKAALDYYTYSHFIMISGQCYPIKPMSFICDFLNNNHGTSFMEFFPIPTDVLGVNKGLDRINCYSYTLLGKRITFYTSDMTTTFNLKGKALNLALRLLHYFRKRRSFPSKWKPFYGADWWVLSWDAASYIITFVTKNPDYHRYHRHTRHTSEVYFQSILLGSGFKGRVVNRLLHYVAWSSENSAHPVLLSEADFDDIKNSDYLFARKFCSKISNLLLKRIDNEIL